MEIKRRMAGRRDAKRRSLADEHPESSASRLHVEAASLRESNTTPVNCDKGLDQVQEGARAGRRQVRSRDSVLAANENGSSYTFQSMSTRVISYEGGETVS